MEDNDRIVPLVVKSVAVVGIVWVLMVLGIRLYLRLKLNGPVGKDDYAAIVATGLGIAQSALVIAAADAGLGKVAGAVDDEQIGKIMKVRTLPTMPASSSSQATVANRRPDWLRGKFAVRVRYLYFSSVKLLALHPLDINKISPLRRLCRIERQYNRRLGVHHDCRLPMRDA